MNVKETKGKTNFNNLIYGIFNFDILIELIALAKAKNLFLMEAMWSRVQPAHLRIKV